MALPPITSSQPDSFIRNTAGSPTLPDPTSPTTAPRPSNFSPVAHLRPTLSTPATPVPSTPLMATGASTPSRATGVITPSRSVALGTLPSAPLPSVSAPLAPSRRSGAVPSIVSPRVDTGPRNLTQPQMAERLHGQLMNVLRTEWKRIKSSNLGVLSGTAVVEELLLRRIQATAGRLHSLVVREVSGAERLGQLCRAMDRTELQQLLVMFDQTGHPDLADFVRVLVFNTSDPSAKGEVGDLRVLSGRRARSTPSSRRVGLPPGPPRPICSASEDPRALRFAGLLPTGHPLVAAAQDAAEARRRAVEEEERRAAEARAAKARLRSSDTTLAASRLERRPSDTATRRSLLLLGRSTPDILPYFLADVEEQWQRTVGTRVPAEGVFDSCIMLGEPLPAYEVPPEAAVLREQAEAEALAPPPSRHGPNSQTGRIAPGLLPGFLGPRGGGGASGSPTWQQSGGGAVGAAGYKRLSSAKPGHVASGVSPLPPLQQQGAGGLGAESSSGVQVHEGSGSGGSGPASSRFNGPGGRRGGGSRAVSVVQEAGEGGGQGGEGAGGEGGRAQYRSSNTGGGSLGGAGGSGGSAGHGAGGRAVVQVGG